MLKIAKLVILSVLFISCSNNKEPVDGTDSRNHPNLILTAQAVSEIKSQLGAIPIFDETLALAKERVDAAIEKGIDVPMPKDMAGGYTHTQHKLNYANMQKAGILFQLLEGIVNKICNLISNKDKNH